MRWNDPNQGLYIGSFFCVTGLMGILAAIIGAELDRKKGAKSMIDWKRKLTSRKFWAALCNFVGMLVVAMGGTAGSAEKITALIMAGATVIAYIIAEGLVDAAGAGAEYVIDEPEEEGEE